jgi:hypothetical protein
MKTPNEDIRKCVEGVAKLVEESLPVVYYATHESIEANKVYQFSNPTWFLLSPGDFEKLKKGAEVKVRLKHVREMPVEAMRQNVIPDITTAYNSAGDVCWMCELCATTVPCSDGDPLPDGWRMGHTPQGPGPICKACNDEDGEAGER